MDDSFENIKKDWKKAQASQSKVEISSSEIKRKSDHEVSKSQRMQGWNIAILSLTLIGITAFFYFVAPVQETISRIGVALMVGGLIIRIGAEIISVAKAKNLKMDLNAADLNAAAIHYHAHRKKIHGAFTTLILVAYVVGIALLVPEFSLYLSKTALLGIGIGSVFGAWLVGYSIRRGIRDELVILERLKKLQLSMGEEVKK